MIRKVKNSKKGFTIIELLVVLLVISLIVVGVVSLAATSTKNARFTKEQATASRYAQEALEWVRQQRDSGWTAFYARAGRTYCMTTPSWSVSVACTSTDVIPNTPYIREVTLTPTDANNVTVEVVVAWSDSQNSATCVPSTPGTCAHRSHLTTYLTNWK